MVETASSDQSNAAGYGEAAADIRPNDAEEDCPSCYSSLARDPSIAKPHAKSIGEHAYRLRVVFSLRLSRGMQTALGIAGDDSRGSFAPSRRDRGLRRDRFTCA